MKIGKKVFDSESERIVLILTDADKLAIARMEKDKHKYCAEPHWRKIKFYDEPADLGGVPV